MRRSLLLPALLVSLAACGGAEVPAPATPAGAKAEGQRVAAVDYFDVAAVTAAPPVLARRLGNEGLLGVDLAARPALLECLVDPRNRGGEKATHVVVEGAINGEGVQHKVSGTNLTPAGVACMEAALKAWTKGIPAGPGAPVTSQMELDHVVGVQPAVGLGNGDASDLAAAVRLALPGFGECFAGWTSAAPRTLRATLRAAKPRDGSPAVLLSSVAFDPTPDPVAGKVAACLEGKLKALPVKPPSGDSVTASVALRLVHSGIEGALPDAPPELQLVELDLQRARRLADVTLAVDEHAQALATYDELVRRYKSRGRPEVSLADLKDKCAALVAADDRLLAASERQSATEHATHHFAEARKAKDPSWTEAEATSAKSLAEAEKELAAHQGLRRIDEAACPKSAGDHDHGP
jgi:hypothetical protein